MPTPTKNVYVVIRYFYEADFSRWENLERRGVIHGNQLTLLQAYRKIKTVTPQSRGMTATTMNGKTVYEAILPH